jgi:tripartite-type tricarboxylate transporter receptor subunit TctC
VHALNKSMNKALDDPAVHQRLQDLGLEIAPPDQRTPEYLAKFVPEEIARWSKVVRAAGIIPN